MRARDVKLRHGYCVTARRSWISSARDLSVQEKKKRQNGEPDLERLRAAASCSRGSMLPLRETKFIKCELKLVGRTMIDEMMFAVCDRRRPPHSEDSQGLSNLQDAWLSGYLADMQRTKHGLARSDPCRSFSSQLQWHNSATLGCHSLLEIQALQSLPRSTPRFHDSCQETLEDALLVM